MKMTGILPILLGEFYDKLETLKEMHPRAAQFPDAPNKIKVAIGMRRAGKTYFLYHKILEMLATGVSKKAILYLNFEDDRLLPLNSKGLAGLIDAFYSQYPENHDRKCFLFLDEIQNVEDWPVVVRRMHDTKNAEIFLTGSSAKLLSKEIATSLRGRSLAIEIWPYSFEEYGRAKKISFDSPVFDKRMQDSLKELFQDYLSRGGFPEVLSYNSDVRQQTLQEYLDVALYRDIIERHRVKSPSLIKYMILSMIRNVGKPFAIHKFHNDSKSQGYKVGKDSLYEYADHIEDAYLAFSVPLFDHSIRKSQNKPKKLYAIDPGLVRALTLDYEKDLGRLFENVVYLDLRRQGYKVFYYLTSKGYEIDFLAQTPRGEKTLIQVVWDMEDSSTREREERALEAGMKEGKIRGKIITLESYLREGLGIGQK